MDTRKELAILRAEFESFRQSSIMIHQILQQQHDNAIGEFQKKLDHLTDVQEQTQGMVARLVAIAEKVVAKSA